MSVGGGLVDSLEMSRLTGFRAPFNCSRLKSSPTGLAVVDLIEKAKRKYKKENCMVKNSDN